MDSLLEVVVVEVLIVVVLLVVQILPGEPSNIPSLSTVEVSHASPQRVCAKDDASKNMSAMFSTLDTSHLEMSMLNDDAEPNMATMSVTLDTSHLEMSLLNDVTSRNIKRTEVFEGSPPAGGQFVPGGTAGDKR